MKTDFYSSFEEKFRGSRDLVKSRLEVYLPFVKPLLSIYPEANAVDLGCGRGEWLELLHENGFKAQGVDLNADMLNPAKLSGLAVVLDDAINYLKKSPDASQVIVSAFHFIEHIAFTEVEALIQEAFRVLVPGGILIFETPNPENIVVGTANFYLDPTHKNPIPPQLLAFLPEYYGFSKFKLLRLQEESRLTEPAPLYLLDVLRGASPDCSIVAQKGADEAILQLSEEAFAADYGISLEQLAAAYDRQHAVVLNNIQRFIHFFDRSGSSSGREENLFDKLMVVMQESESNRTELLHQIYQLTSALEESESDRFARAKQINELTILLRASLAERAECLKEIQQLKRKSKQFKTARLFFAKKAEKKPMNWRYLLPFLRKCATKLRIKGAIRKML